MLRLSNLPCVLTGFILIATSITLASENEILWDRTYGGFADESANVILETNDGGLLLAGTTESFGAGFTGTGKMVLMK